MHGKKFAIAIFKIWATYLYSIQIPLADKIKEHQLYSTFSILRAFDK